MPSSNNTIPGWRINKRITRLYELYDSRAIIDLTYGVLPYGVRRALYFAHDMSRKRRKGSTSGSILQNKEQSWLAVIFSMLICFPRHSSENKVNNDFESLLRANFHQLKIRYFKRVRIYSYYGKDDVIWLINITYWAETVFRNEHFRS